MAVSVFIADDHAFTVQGMTAAVESVVGFEVVGTASSGLEAIAAVKRLQPDIMLLDLVMPDASGLEVFVEARRWSPDTKGAIITGTPGPAIFSQLADAGVHGLFIKTAPPEEICDGIARIARGERVFSEEAQQIIDEATTAEQLSDREMEVLQSIANGLTNAGIAERLGISPKTVDNHRTNLMRKLNVRSTASLLVRAMREGLITV